MPEGWQENGPHMTRNLWVICGVYAEFRSLPHSLGKLGGKFKYMLSSEHAESADYVLNTLWVFHCMVCNCLLTVYYKLCHQWHLQVYILFFPFFWVTSWLFLSTLHCHNCHVWHNSYTRSFKFMSNTRIFSYWTQIILDAQCHSVHKWAELTHLEKRKKKKITECTMHNLGLVVGTLWSWIWTETFITRFLGNQVMKLI